MTEQLFVYGTLKLPEVQREVIGREVELLADTIRGFATESILLDEVEYLILVPSENSEVEGAVISITKDELAQIDKYEPEEYERIAVKTESGMHVWVYVSSSVSLAGK